jgi:hypothetical protein
LAVDAICAAPSDRKPGRAHDNGAQIVGRAGHSMQLSFEEAVRAIRIRYPRWDGGKIQISFSEKYTEQDGGSAGAAFALLLLSAFEGHDLDPKCALTGDVTVDWKVRKVGAVAAKVRGAALDKCLYVVIPAENESSFADMPLLYGLPTLWDIQTLSASTLQDALAVTRQDRTPQLTDALRMFSELQPQLAKPNGQALRNPTVKAALQRILELAPNHLSAKYLLAEAENTGPKTLSARASLYELSVIAYPYQGFLSGRGQVTRASLPVGTTANARRHLNALRPIINKDIQPLLLDLSAYVEKAEAVAGKGAKLAELEERRGALLSHMSAVSVSREVMEKLVREGY